MKKTPNGLSFLKEYLVQKGLIVKCPYFDVNDDGHYFKGYLYKRILPITSLTYQGYTYTSIRYDYIPDYKSILSPSEISTISYIADEYNGTDKDEFDKKDFIDNCEEIYKYFLSKGSIEDYINNIIEYILEEIVFEKSFLNKNGAGFRPQLFFKNIFNKDFIKYEQQQIKEFTNKEVSADFIKNFYKKKYPKEYKDIKEDLS